MGDEAFSTCAERGTVMKRGAARPSKVVKLRLSPVAAERNTRKNGTGRPARSRDETGGFTKLQMLVSSNSVE